MNGNDSLWTIGQCVGVLGELPQQIEQGMIDVFYRQDGLSQGKYVDLRELLGSEISLNCSCIMANNGFEEVFRNRRVLEGRMYMTLRALGRFKFKTEKGLFIGEISHGDIVQHQGDFLLLSGRNYSFGGQ